MKFVVSLLIALIDLAQFNNVSEISCNKNILAQVLARTASRKLDRANDRLLDRAAAI